MAGAAALAVAVGALLGACGDGGVPAGSDEQPLGGGLGLSVAFEPDPLRSGKAVTWTLVVRNDGVEAATLTFPSSKPGDVVLRRGGDEVYRWSDDRLFTQVVRKEVIGPNEERSYRLEEGALAVEPGTYDLVATLAAEPDPGPVRQRVDVE